MNGLANDPARLHVQSRLGPVGGAKRAGVPIPQRPFALGHRARAAADNGMGDGLHGRHARPLRAVCAPVLTYTALAVLCIAVLEVAHVIGRLYRFRADRDRWMRHNGDLAGLPMGCRSAGQAAEHSRGGRWSRVAPQDAARISRAISDARAECRAQAMKRGTDGVMVQGASCLVRRHRAACGGDRRAMFWGTTHRQGSPRWRSPRPCRNCSWCSHWSSSWYGRRHTPSAASHDHVGC